jgi:hypothetical protein
MIVKKNCMTKKIFAWQIADKKKNILHDGKKNFTAEKKFEESNLQDNFFLDNMNYACRWPLPGALM